MSRGLKAGQALKPCGTSAAYRRHLRNNEEPCQACRDAENRRQRKGPRPRMPSRCGTNSGYARHLRAREAACDACRERVQRSRARRKEATS